jgi:hypothetical protein
MICLPSQSAHFAHNTLSIPTPIPFSRQYRPIKPDPQTPLPTTVAIQIG